MRKLGEALVAVALTCVASGCGSGGTNCSPETDSAFCSRIGKNCGAVSANDNCGAQRSVASCGTCTSPQSCAGNGTANVCETPVFAVAVSIAGSGSGTVTSTPSGINCGTSCSTSFGMGSTVTLTATPAADSMFSGFTGDCTGASCSLSVGSAKSVTATFVKLHTLTVTASGTGGGSISSDTTPAISCSATAGTTSGTCSVQLPEGTRVTLTPAASSGSRFDSWGDACSGAGCTFALTGDATVTAAFVQQYTVTVTFAGDGGGTVDFGGAAAACTSSCSATIDKGTAVTATGTASGTDVFTGFTGDVTGNPSFTIGSFSADVSVTATFQQTHTISVTVVGGGSVSSSPAGISGCTSSCSATFADGSPVTLTATASGSATFSGWQGGCTGNSTCQITLAGSSSSTTATFVSSTSSVFGGPGDQFATGIAYANGQLWVSGNEAGGAGGILARLSLPIGTPDFVNVWPASNANQSTFSGIAAGPSAVYAVGSSVAMTSDCAGGVETKMTILKYPFATTGAPSAYEWFSNVGGSCAIEYLAGAAALSESGTTYLYGVGLAQYPNRDTVIKAMDPSGSPTSQPAGSSTVWTQFFTTTGDAGGNGVYPIVGGGGVYVVGADNDSYPPTYPILAAYDASGAETWSVRGPASFAYSGFFRAVTAAGNSVYAVGQTAGSVTDYVVEKYDSSGVRQWTKTYDSGNANDALTAVVALGTHVYAVGFTGPSATSGCNQSTPCKAVLLDLSAADGALLNTTVYGDGVNDTVAYGIATDGIDLYLAGHQYTGATNGYEIYVAKYPGPDAFTVGGTVTGLSGTGLVLQNSATGEQLPLSANGNFTFTTSVASGAPYTVSVKTAPTNPDSTTQTCTVTNGTATATGSASDVQVDCTPWILAGSLQGPNTVRVAGGRVYFATSASASCYGATSGDYVWLVSASGGTPQSIAAVDHYAGNCGAYGLVTDSTSVYWLNYADAWLSKANLDGTNPTNVVQVAGQYGNALAIDAAGGKLFYHAYPNTSIGRVATDGSGNATFANTASINGQNLAIDASSLYWTDSPAGYVYKLALNTASLPASPSPVVTGESGPFAPFVTASALYWIAGSAARSTALPSGTAHNVATGLTSPNSLVADANSVWVVGGGSSGVVYKIPAGGGTPVTIAKSLDNPSSLATDGTRLYFATGTGSSTTGTITMILK